MAIGLDPGYADLVVDAPGATGEGFLDAQLAVNGVRGAGAQTGSTDVFSLGLHAELDAWMVLSWSAGPVYDGPGPDLAVFENPFDYDGGRFFDPIVVELSSNGADWVAFDHQHLGGDWEGDATNWIGFAGLSPVLLNVDTNPTAPLDSAVAGGDAFDLADLPEGPVTDDILSAGASFIRLTSAAALVDPNTGQAYARDPVSNGADVDGVYGRVD